MQRFLIQFDSGLFRHVRHIQGQNHGPFQFQQLNGQVQISFQIGGIQNIDNQVRFFIYNDIPSHHFVHGISRKAVRARQIDDRQILSLKTAKPFPPFDGNARIISDMLPGAGDIVENRSLAGVGISRQSNRYARRRHYAFPPVGFMSIVDASAFRSDKLKFFTFTSIGSPNGANFNTTTSVPATNPISTIRRFIGPVPFILVMTPVSPGCIIANVFFMRPPHPSINDNIFHLLLYYREIHLVSMIK